MPIPVAGMLPWVNVKSSSGSGAGLHSKHDDPAILASSGEQDYSQEAEEPEEESIEHSDYSESELGNTGGPAAMSAYPRREYTFASDDKEPSGLKFTPRWVQSTMGKSLSFATRKQWRNGLSSQLCLKPKQAPIYSWD